MKKVMFVCTGNICRSAMAEYYMKSKLSDLNIDSIEVDSCGIQAIDGEQASKNDNIALSKYMVTIPESYKATNVMRTDIETFDVVLAMTVQQKYDLLKMFPGLNGKIFTLIEYANNTSVYKDIDDPWGLGIGVYDACAKSIVENVDILIQKLIDKN